MVDIFQLAAKERSINKQLQEEERTILFVGSKQGGKTTLIYQFLDRADEAPKPTLALEYAFGRKSRTQDLGKDVVHIWELGGGDALCKLVDTPITGQSLRTLALVMVLDLSMPAAIWATFHALYGEAQQRIEKVMGDLKRKDSKIPAYLKKKCWLPYGENHPDADLVTPCAVPFVILATKYDKFQDLEPEQRKIVSKTLRFLAHTRGASLLFTSNKDEATMGRCRTMLNMLAFKAGAPPRSLLVDPAKPLIVPVGADSLAQIGPPPAVKDSAAELRRPDDLWRVAFQHCFPASVGAASAKDSAAAAAADPSAAPKYAEEAIDALRAHKEEELERYRRQAERRAAAAAAAASAAHGSGEDGGDGGAGDAEVAQATRTPQRSSKAPSASAATPGQSSRPSASSASSRL